MNKEIIIDIAKKCGADIGTWDRSGNGANVVSFSIEELMRFAIAILENNRE